MNTKLYSLRITERKSYLMALVFVAGNVILPQLCHLVPQGGMILLPIYFFTLIAAYKYGYVTGFTTALLSPLINHLLFGMPAFDMLPVLLLKSSLLAFAAAYAAQRLEKVSPLALVGVILFYQGLGFVGEYALTGSFAMAFQDIRIGFPGMLLQLVGGWAVLRTLTR